MGVNLYFQHLSSPCDTWHVGGFPRWAFVGRGEHLEIKVAEARWSVHQVEELRQGASVPSAGWAEGSVGLRGKRGAVFLVGEVPPFQREIKG